MSFRIKRGDIYPILKTRALMPDGVTPMDLTGVVYVRFKMRDASGSTLLVDALAAITDVPNGLMEYHWAAGDTNAVAECRGEFELSYAVGAPLTLPTSGYLPISIFSDLDVDPGPAVAPWVTVQIATTNYLIKRAKLAQLSNDPAERTILEPDAGLVYSTPFYQPTGLHVYVGSTELTLTTNYTTDELGDGGRTRFTLLAAPAGPVTVSADEAINLDSFDAAMRRATTDIRSIVKAARWVFPEDTEAAPGDPVLGWIVDYGVYYIGSSGHGSSLVGNDRTPGPYFDVFVRRELTREALKQLTLSQLSLDGVLARATIPDDPGTSPAAIGRYGGEPRLFDPYGAEDPY